jgi:hypothetical protein
MPQGACGIGKIRYGGVGLPTPGSRRDSRRQGFDKAAYHHEQRKATDTVFLKHDGRIISQAVTFLYTKPRQSDKIQPAPFGKLRASAGIIEP